MIDIRPATDRVDGLLDFSDDELDGQTPCTDYTVRDLLHHLLGLTIAFRDAAGKVEGPTTSTPPGRVVDPLPVDWRARLRTQLRDLSEAWGQPRAWEGMTMAGGVRFPAEAAGLVALNEVQLHGWDLARATGHDYRPDDELAAAVLPIVTPTGDPDADAGREGMFGPPLDVRPGAPLFDRVVALAGRDVDWARA